MAKLTPFGKALRVYRVNHEQSQYDVADALGVSVAFWSALETGKKNASKELQKKIVAHFGLNNIQVAELEHLALLSQQEININMTKLNDRSRELVVGFARNFSSLDDEKQKKLKKLLEMED